MTQKSMFFDGSASEPDVRRAKAIRVNQSVGLLDIAGGRCTNIGLTALAASGVTGLVAILANVAAPSTAPMAAAVATVFPLSTMVPLMAALVVTVVMSGALLEAGTYMQRKSMKTWNKAVEEDAPMLRAVQIERAEKTVGILEKKQDRCFTVESTSGFLTVAGAAVAAVGFLFSLPILMPALAVTACAAVVTGGAIALGKHYSSKETEEARRVKRIKENQPGNPS